jgi:type II secretory pathway component GspD/PulD (secretin)
MIAMLGFAGHVRSEQTGSTTLEPIGKEDPFEVVSPIVEAKKKIVQRFTGTTEIIEVIPDLFVETVMLKFLRASNLEPVIANLNSAHGTIAVDQETNSLIICDSAGKLDMIVEQIRKADQMPKQILVEVVIVDVQLNDETEIGVDWTDLLGDSVSANDVGIPGIPAGTHNNSFSQGLIPDSLTDGSTLHFIRNNIGVTLQALQQVRDVEILASPKLLVLSGQEATIKTVEEIPYKEQSDTSLGGSLTSTEFKEAGITLTVKATLTDEGKILVVIDAEQSVNTGANTVTDSTVPVVDTRSAKTTLLMEHDQVVVMGGLRRKETRISNNKVPLLGDLPLIGFLFSNDKTEIKNTELLIFISPHISINESPSEEEMKRYNELKDTPMLEFKQEKEHRRNPLGILNW